MDLSNISSKVILVTGASSGIGEATAKAFASQGACLSITGRNESNLENVAQECRLIGAKQVLVTVADLALQCDIEKVVKATIKQFERLDVLINNAGLWREGGVENTNSDDFDVLFNVNVKAPLFLTQLCVSYLEKSKGNIVNVSSIDSQCHYTNSLDYGMTKSALDKFTKTVALDLAKKSIRVNTINPALCQTNIFANRFNSKEEASLHFKNEEKTHPLGEKNIEVGELTDAILFLSSNSARMITGTCLNVDGGRALTGQ